jgi:hypothetical protein
MTSFPSCLLRAVLFWCLCFDSFQIMCANLPVGSCITGPSIWTKRGMLSTSEPCKYSPQKLVSSCSIKMKCYSRIVFRFRPSLWGFFGRKVVAWEPLLSRTVQCRKAGNNDIKASLWSKSKVKGRGGLWDCESWRIMPLGLTQPLTEMSMRILPGR